MRFLLLALAAFFAFQVQAQELVKVVDFNSQKRESEEFYVLKKDNKTRHGNYKRIDTAKKKVLVEGFYRHNLKDSLWTEYLRGTSIKMKEGYYIKGERHGLWRENGRADSIIYLKEKGAYKNNVRVGPWSFYNKGGEIQEVYDFSLDSLLYVKPPADTAKYEVWLDNTWQRRKLDRLAGVIRDKEGKDQMAELYSQIRYPVMAAMAGAEGIVLIACSVNEKGETENFIVQKRVHPLLNAEALRVAKLNKLKFYPALLNGKPVTTKAIFPFVFNIK